MLPSSSHSHHHRSNVINGHTSTSQLVAGSSSSTVDPPNTQTLFTSLLAPPPPTQARTILNANDPPIPAPVRPAPSPRVVRNTKPKIARSIAEGTRAQAKNRESPSTASTAVVTASPNNKRKGKRPAATEKGGPAKRRKENKRGNAVDADGDLDMEAAATLTSLLLHHRPSIASSPRSSVDGGAMSDGAGSTQSQAPSFSSAYSQGTARGVASAMSSTTLTDDRGIESRSRTPPLPGSKTPVAGNTPRPPTDKDNEAADLMLYLATSPSPARPTNKDSKDLAAFRALGGGGGVRPKGRVLFPSHNSSAGEPPASQRERGHAPALLSRNDGGSFHSSISSIGSEMSVHSQYDRPPSRSSQQAQQSQGNLLPPATVSLAPSSPLRREMERSPPRAGGNSAGGSTTPGGPDNFNFSEYINASPIASPVRGGAPPAHHGGSLAVGKGLGLRADVGRKLFEEEQMRLGLSSGGSGGNFGSTISPQHQFQQGPTKVGGRPSSEHASAAQMHLQGRRSELTDRGRSLEAGIDLVQT
uniref:Uncharacterized protein n=1 Tax=Moniliophthora roreri TaxID=221103 RepID=A0A0W0FGP1_MONRR